MCLAYLKVTFEVNQTDLPDPTFRKLSISSVLLIPFKLVIHMAYLNANELTNTDMEEYI